MKTILLAISISLTTLPQLFAQDLAYKKYTWETLPKLHTITDSEKESNYVTIKDKNIYEYVFETSGELVMYETSHNIIHFNTDAGVEAMNKIYIPLSSVLEEIDLKARTITATGKIIYLNKDGVKKVENLDDSGPYLIFAMEGVEKGAEIEYMITNKKSASTYFSTKMQFAIPQNNVSVDVYSPESLVFEAKGYNGFPSAGTDTTIKGKKHIYASMDKIEPFADEKYTFENAAKMRLDVQLAYNFNKNKARIFTWEAMGRNMYEGAFNASKAELKAAAKLTGKLDIEKENADFDKMLKLEQWMKINVEIKESTPKSEITTMLDNKYGNELAVVRLYIAAAQNLNIPVELVLVSDRTKRHFDAQTPSYSSLQEYLLYFPSIGKYMSPGNYYSRIGFPPPNYIGDKALFIKESSVGDIKTGVSKIKNIDGNNHALSLNNIDAVVNFNETTYTPTISYIHTNTGYSAYYIQPGIPVMNADQKKLFLDEMMKTTGKETIVKSVKIQGDKPADVLTKPLIISGDVEAPHLMENAGSKLLFKVGDLIGPQDELYQKNERKLDGELMYAHTLDRNITVNIPKGYKVVNVSSINIDKKCADNDKLIALFTSSYTQEGNVLKITIKEEYRELYFPKAKYEDYRTVINAAADFNKITLIFEKL
jgi:hypothetical protein